MSKNDITGDKLVSKVQSEKFSEGYDRIWGKSICEHEEVKTFQASKTAELRQKLENENAVKNIVGEIYRRSENQAIFEKAFLAPEGYTAEELERDNPYNQWMYEGENKC